MENKKRILAFILGLCVMATGAILVSQESLFSQVIGACSIAYAAFLITLAALTEER
jgi:hypothetical protein